MFHGKKTYLAIYEVKDATGHYQIDFTTLIRSKPPRPEEFILRQGYTKRIIIFEVKELFSANTVL